MIRRLQKGSVEDDAILAALATKRARILDMAADGMIDKADAQRRLIEVAEAESKLSTRRWVRQVTRPPLIADAIDEDGTIVKADEPARVNAYLRRLFDGVTVDMSEPARRGPSHWVPRLTFAWRDPSMRVEDVEDADDTA
jgi:hypothetical protein